jgi:hypothetical protein
MFQPKERDQGWVQFVDLRSLQHYMVDGVVRMSLNASTHGSL